MLFDKKIEILEANPRFFKYHSIESLDSKKSERLLKYINAIIEIEEQKNMIDLIGVKEISATLEKYAIEINKKIYGYFSRLPNTYGLHYCYYTDGFHLYEKLDWLKDCFQYTLKFLDTNTYDTNKLEEEIKKLMIDDDVTNRKGIYFYVLTRNEKYLNIRAFTEQQKRKAYEKQNGLCKICGNHFDINEMEADHITPWHAGGKTSDENCQMLCRNCNRHKSGI